MSDRAVRSGSKDMRGGCSAPVEHRIVARAAELRVRAHVARVVVVVAQHRQLRVGGLLTHSLAAGREEAVVERLSFGDHQQKPSFVSHCRKA